jgi:hypothetical protein
MTRPRKMFFFCLLVTFLCSFACTGCTVVLKKYTAHVTKRYHIAPGSEKDVPKTITVDSNRSKYTVQGKWDDNDLQTIQVITELYAKFKSGVVNIFDVFKDVSNTGDDSDSDTSQPQNLKEDALIEMLLENLTQ